MDAPVIQYARTTDGLSIAYYAIGDGAPPLVYLTPGSHLEREWAYPEQRAWLQRLAQNHRLIRFDARGIGLSDRTQVFAPENATRDIEAVVRKERLNRFALMGGVGSAAIAVLYACQHPKQVTHLVLWCPYGRFRDFVASSPPLQALRAARPKDWHTYTEFLAEFLTGREDIDQARRFAAYLRELWTPDQYALSMEAGAEVDLTANLRKLALPVLVVQRREAAFPTTDVARKVAAEAPGARLVLLEGSAVAPFLGDTTTGIDTINQFLSEANAPRPDGLTEREVEILTLLAGGASNERIARSLSISTRTAERHVRNIYVKIVARNRADATAYAFRHGLTPST
jgi:pimeloyl-ACP methyl ester carboxylesterase